MKILFLTVLTWIVCVTVAQYADYDEPTDEDIQEIIQQLYDQDDETNENLAQSDPIDDFAPVVQVWPSDSVTNMVGQIGGLAVDGDNNLVVFHRGSREWQFDSFDEKNVFQHQKSAIVEPTLLTVDQSTGDVIAEAGAHQFYMPHGLTIDHKGNKWLTDVATHQVHKLAPGSDKPVLTLGEKFVPGDDEEHFCKPTDVAVAKNGDFFVADGYCNSRVMKFSMDGTFITQFGSKSDSDEYPAPAGTLRIPHSITLVEDWNLVCVADRENERIQCFTAGLRPAAIAGRQLPTGIMLKSANNLGRVFAIRAHGHNLYGVTNMGLAAGENQVFMVDLRNGQAETVAPGLENPHAIAVDGEGAVYVGEAGPNRVLKIE